MGDKLIAMQEQMARLERENSKLRHLMDLEDRTVVSLDEKHAHTLSPCGDVFTPREITALKSFFDHFDDNQSGTIGINKLKHLHSELGEPLTDEEAHIYMDSIDHKAEYEITFPEFLNWWKLTHVNFERYKRKFKLMSAGVKPSFFELKRIVTFSCGGDFGTLEYRLGFKYTMPDGSLKSISPWHDIPLYANRQAKYFHFLCEIPKWTRAKYEVATGEVHNPIKQDVRNGRLRFYQHGDMCFNYGLFPQTWEDPARITPDTGCKGDNDPIDAVEIGYKQIPTGEVRVVKVIGVLALIDNGETDWKLIVIDINDPLASALTCTEDLERELPGCTHAIREYFRIYKVCTGHEPNGFGVNGAVLEAEYAHDVIEETHQFWTELRARNLQSQV